MPITDVEKAVRKRLATLTPTLQTAQENIPFTAPEGMYQRLQFVISPPTDPTFGKYYHRENVQAQVFVCDKLGVGSTAAISRAELIRDLFSKGTTLEENGTRMHILRTPQIAGAVVAADRFIVPVLIPVTVEVYEP